MTLKEKMKFNQRCMEYMHPETRGKLTSKQIANVPYYSDWNLIMNVVEQIEEENYVLYFIIEQPNISILATEELNLGFEDIVIDIYKMTKKEAVVKAINQFLTWHEKNIRA